MVEQRIKYTESYPDKWEQIYSNTPDIVLWDTLKEFYSHMSDIKKICKDFDLKEEVSNILFTAYGFVDYNDLGRCVDDLFERNKDNPIGQEMDHKHKHTITKANDFWIVPTALIYEGYDPRNDPYVD